MDSELEAGLEPSGSLERACQMPILSERVRALTDGVCDAAILHEDYWSAQRIANPHHCNNKYRLRETVASVDNSYPVRSELERVLSWQIQRRLERGRYAALAAEARLNYTVAPCRERPASSQYRQLGMREMGGPIALIALGVSISIIATRIGLASQWRAKVVSITVAESVRARSQSVAGAVATSRRSSQRVSNSGRDDSAAEQATMSPRPSISRRVNERDNRAEVVPAASPRQRGTYPASITAPQGKWVVDSATSGVPA